MADANTPNPTLSPDITADTHTALDALFKEVTETEIEPKPGETPEEKPVAEVPEEKPPVETPKPEEKPVEAPKPESSDNLPKPEEKPTIKDNLDEVALPPYSKPKTTDSFNEVKKRARETITARDAEIARLNQELAAREEKLKGALPTEATKELEELRTFRRSVDIENDPEFRGRFDGKIETNNNAIMSKLSEAGMGQEQIDAIKKLGGPEQVDWEPLLPKLPVALRRFIETKLVQNEDLRTEKKDTVTQARKDPSIFEKQKVEQRSKVLVETANQHLSKLAWTVEKPIPANATPEEKAKLTAANAVAKQAQGLVQDALKDYNPATFAELAVGTAFAHKFKSDLEASTAEKSKLAENLAKVEKERDALKTELAKIKSASSTHRGSTITPPPAPANPFQRGADALDALFKETSR